MNEGDDDASIAKLDVKRFSTPIQQLARDLLLYKALFQGDWFARLAEAGSDPLERQVLGLIHEETLREAEQARQALASWSDHPATSAEVVPLLRGRMLADLIHIKESTTEAYLLAGMRAPTEALRRRFLQLADTDRRHADALRELVGQTAVATLEPRPHWELTDDDCAGVYRGREGAHTFSGALKAALADVRADGQEPAGLVLSAIALRHARDEGLLESADGTILGLAVAVDLGWRGECFALTTKERVTLAELIAASGAAKAPPA